MAERQAATARAVALAGPYGSGKTTLLEALLFAADAKDQIGAHGTNERTGDRSPESRERGISTEMNIAGLTYLDDRYWILDLPGSVEFSAEARAALPVADAVVVVCEPDLDKIAALQPWLAELDEAGVPHMLFVNKIDTAHLRVRDLFAALSDASRRPLVMRQIPIWEGEEVSGFVDLALERAYVYRTGKPSQQVDIPSALADREADARFQMLEKLADFDDDLMETLLEDAKPDRDVVFADLSRELREGLITPVFLGSAEKGGGVRRLLKALRHELPPLEATAARVLGSDAGEEPTLQVVKTMHVGQAGKVSIARVLSGAIKDGTTYARADGDTARGGGLFALDGVDMAKVEDAGPGDVVAVGRLGDVATGEFLVAGAKGRTNPAGANAPKPVFARALSVPDRKDEVKLSAALAKLIEEDTGLVVTPDAETGELLLKGQGEVHLATAMARLERKFGVHVDASTPMTPYKETIRKGVTKRGKHKKQSGGHGQFGDVELEIKPLARGSGFQFDQRITGGVVPRTYFTAVEAGARDATQKGPLGFPVVDISVTLVDGSYHAVDSSEIAFRTAGRIAVHDALPECSPVLLEPILKAVIYAPSEAMSKVTSILSSRRGQILGFDARPGWNGWDRVEGYLPQAEAGDLIIELRSATHGAGTFEAHFERMAELTGRSADDVVKARTAAV